jgi:hypothetical protein
MNPLAQQTLEEIRQLITQYRNEVPGRRRAWPESIKIRVARLSEFGLTPKEISSHSQLSYYTVLGWVPAEHRRRYRSRRHQVDGNGTFSPVQIRAERAIATVTVAKSSGRLGRSAGPPFCGRAPAIIATVTVTLPSGIRIDGVTPQFLQSWLGQGGGNQS